MNEIQLVDSECCPTAGMGEYQAFLSRKFAERAVVRHYSVNDDGSPSDMPAELHRSLVAQGARSIPVLAIDGRLVSQGSVPEWLSSLDIIELELRSGAEASKS